MRILNRYIYKELLLTYSAVTIVLLLITFGSQATRFLAEAIEGDIPAGLVLPLLFLKILPALEIVLPLASLLTVMLAIGRLYQDQEMVVLKSCGINDHFFKQTVILFFLPIALLTAWVSLALAPWSYAYSTALIQASNMTPVSGLVEGKFNPLPQQSGALYAQQIDSTGSLRQIWLKYQTPTEDILVVAPKGRFDKLEGKTLLLLENGYSYQNFHTSETKATPDKKSIHQFTHLEIYIPALQSAPREKRSREKSTTTLWHSDALAAQAMLQWRLATPLGVFVLALLALKLSRVGPREGRFGKLVWALLLYMLYNQFMLFAREAIEEGLWPEWLGLWPILLLFLWFALGQHLWAKQLLDKLKQQLVLRMHSKG